MEARGGQVTTGGAKGAKVEAEEMGSAAVRNGEAVGSRGCKDPSGTVKDRQGGGWGRIGESLGRARGAEGESRGVIREEDAAVISCGGGGGTAV